MKKIFIYLAIASVATISCRKDDTPAAEPEVSIETQNSYDDQAAQQFLDTHYLDAKGNVKELAATDVTNVKLSSLNPITLPSGVIYIARNAAQPSPGTTISANNKIRLMVVANSYIATNADNKLTFQAPAFFRNTLTTTGTPEVEPTYFYIKNSLLKAFNDTYKTNYGHSFFEIEGFNEALQKFKAFDIPDETGYNLQGVIIVPSRAAYGRDPHYTTSISFRNRCFVFSFQVYKSEPRAAGDD